MRRVRLDENLPRKLRRDLTEFAVRTVQEENWTSYANGQLLGRAQDRFDVLLTADRRLQFQQNLARYRIGVVVILTVSLRYRTLAKRLLDSLDELAPQEYERMWVEEAARRYQQLKDGTARSFASEEVFARLDARPRR